MKWTNFLPKLKLPKSFQFNPDKVQSWKLHRVWEKFLKQIPHEFRSVIKTHQHFLLLGDEKSGKTELVHGIVEQSQNIYPFEVEYEKDENLQFYLGPKQIIQEISLKVMKDRTIKLRRNLIHLWKRLFVKEPPIVVITRNPWAEQSKDVREINKTARLIAGKLTLLAELCKAPIKVRVALTHLDKLGGYLEFAHFLKQHNIPFRIPLTTNFENEAIKNALLAFRNDHLSLILTSCSAQNFTKILEMFDQLSKLFPLIEEFLRALTSENTSTKVELEFLTLFSNFESYTAFSSFDWKQIGPSSLFNRHPMLKHQIASACFLLICSGLILNNFFRDHHQINLSKKGIDSLVFLQQRVFVEEIIPQIEQVNQARPQECYLPFLPRFYKKELRETNQHLADRVRKHILEPSLRRILLQEKSELRTIYMLGLLHASKDNLLGEHILKNLSDWANTLYLDESLIKAYVFSNFSVSNQSITIDYLDKINASTAISDLKSWDNFLTHFQDLINQPVFTGHRLEDVRKEAFSLLEYYREIKNDEHAFVICNQLREKKSPVLHDFEKNVKALKWIEDHSIELEAFLVFICQTSPDIPNLANLNISQFFVKLKEISDFQDEKEHEFQFPLNDRLYSFKKSKWIKISVSHIVERLINQYTVENNGGRGEIFFRNTPEIAPLKIESHRNEFPYFSEPVIIDGRYTRLAFERNVRYTTESLLGLLESLPINAEDRDRFRKFIKDEVISYVKEYQKNYERLYASSNIRTSNLEEIKETLKKISSSTSSFQHFLNTMTHHTEIFSEPTTCLETFDGLDNFYFLKSIMNQAKNKETPLQGYQTLIQKILDDLNANIIQKNVSNSLDDYLSPAARIAFSILRNDVDSYPNQIIENLITIGVPADYRALFLSPVMQIYQIGIKDLKKGISKLWVESLQPQIDFLFTKKPFNPDGAFAVSVEELSFFLSPRGEFWGTIKQITEPASISQNGMWYPSSSSDLQLDKDFYQVVNRLAKVSNLLWDQEGNPQCIHLMIRSLPFEKKENLYPVPILSYLITGEETFHNFNQNPAWHPIKVAWWKPNSSAIIMELMNKKEDRFHREVKATNILWSFFELLCKGEKKESNTWQWKLPNPFGQDVSTVSLEFQVNPWDLFQINDSEIQE